MDEALEKIVQQLIALPAPGKPAEELTERERLACANAAGVPMEFTIEGAKLVMRSKVPFCIADCSDGTYTIAVLRPWKG